MNLEKLRLIDLKLASIYYCGSREQDRFNFFTHLTPINLDVEKAKFFKVFEKGKDYDPKFRYMPLSRELAFTKKKLEKLEIDHSSLGRILDKKKHELLSKIKIVENIGKPGFTNAAQELFPLPTKSLLSFADKHINLRVREEIQNLSAVDAAKLLSKVLKKYYLNWKVSVATISANMNVNQYNKTLTINKDARFSEKELRSLIVHEIGTHILRSENARTQPYNIFIAFPNYLTTEEGLAIVNEENARCLSLQRAKVLSGRVFASDFALKHSFSETVNRLLRFGFHPQDVWNIVSRTKRGLTDTSKPGVFAKDIAYLDGVMKVKRFIRSGGNLRDLYYGKIGIHDIHIIKEISFLNKKLYIPSFI